ncbi:hypothetical protein BDV93DRAFT_511790 [Ceratobasidium sp. AG-I]|nr:hypothetical protein BDV93DRAFT_511790 [Ceratobasidium sp. AG-I]
MSIPLESLYQKGTCRDPHTDHVDRCTFQKFGPLHYINAATLVSQSQSPSYAKHAEMTTCGLRGSNAIAQLILHTPTTIMPACEDSESVLPASAQVNNTQPYGASDPDSSMAKLRLLTRIPIANLIVRTSDTQFDDSDSSSEDELDVGDEPDEGVPPRTPPSSIEVGVALDKINASSKCEYTYMTYHCNVLVKPLCHLLKQTPESAAGY